MPNETEWLFVKINTIKVHCNAEAITSHCKPEGQQFTILKIYIPVILVINVTQ